MFLCFNWTLDKFKKEGKCIPEELTEKLMKNRRTTSPKFVFCTKFQIIKSNECIYFEKKINCISFDSNTYFDLQYLKFDIDVFN